MLINKTYSDLNHRERKVYDSVYNGWYMGGRYRALFDNHERTFVADSPSILFNRVDRWYKQHEEHHRDARLLVKCVQPL